MKKILVRTPVLVYSVGLKNGEKYLFQTFLPEGFFELEEREDPEFPCGDCNLWYFVRNSDVGHLKADWEEYKAKNLILEKRM